MTLRLGYATSKQAIWPISDRDNEQGRDMQYIPARDNSFTWFSVGFIIGLLIAKLTCTDGPQTPLGRDDKALNKVKVLPHQNKEKGAEKAS
jgi:hypothetical protein